jgi:hypothetical protein
MDPATLRALRGSIAKWQAIVDGTGEDKGHSNCPLCQMFYDEHNDGQSCCAGCPVADATDSTCCVDSPYDDWCAAETDEELKGAALAELAFLRSLLPDEAKA